MKRNNPNLRLVESVAAPKLNMTGAKKTAGSATPQPSAKTRLEEFMAKHRDPFLDSLARNSLESDTQADSLKHLIHEESTQE